MIRNGKFEAGLFDQVKGLCLESFSDESVSFPYSFLERFPNLVALGVAHSCFEEILPSQAQMEEVAALKSLYVGYMDQLKTIWIENDDSHLQPIHQDLESLQVESCGSLIMLTPSFASFEYLTHLTVSGCHQLIYLVTSSTAKSLVRLERLEITDCEKMEEVVRNEISEENVEATIIAFYSLKRLKLSGLRRLKRFCSQNHHTFKFHKLEDVSISGCHQMKMFCPGMEIDEDESSFEGDLNEAIEISLLEKV
ncbi:putative disease resistance protein [Senna tora]|uniref:Putative disease resistance protein n=1 Tax=Senna tora TaxID=362788 RepID=A0A834X915_9FABA|nr:putative disease resistance protein [Senna tora]